MALSKKAARRAALAAAVAGSMTVEAEFNRYDMTLVRLVDSDTYRAVVRLWPGLVQTIDVRVDGIDTPEKFRPSPKCRTRERALANRAAALAETALNDASRVYVTGVGLGKYAGRVVGDVILVDSSGRETRIAGMLMAAGLAVKYHGGKKDRDYWCDAPGKPEGGKP